MNDQDIIQENLLWALIEADLSEAEMERVQIAVVRLFGHVGELPGGTELYREAVKVGYDALPAHKQTLFQRILKKAAEMMDVSAADQRKVIEFAMKSLPGRAQRPGYGAGSKPTTLAASLEQAAADLTETLTLGAKDKDVIDAFGNKQAAEGKKLSTDGKQLDGNWMGGKKLAFWQGEKIHFGAGRPHSKSDEVVMRAIRKYAPRLDLAESAELELIEKAPPGWSGTVKAMKKHMPAEKAFALAWHGHKTGKKPHYKDEGGTMGDGEPTKKKQYECEGMEPGAKDCGCDPCKKKRARKIGEGIDDDRDFLDDPSDMARTGTERETAVPRTPGPIGQQNTVADQRPEQASAKSRNSIASQLASAIGKGMDATGPGNDDTGSIEPDRGDLGANEFRWPDVIARYQDSVMGEGFSLDDAFSLVLAEDGLVEHAPTAEHLSIVDFIVAKQGKVELAELQQAFPITDGWAGKLLLTAAAAFKGTGVSEAEDRRRQADPARWFREKAQPILVAMADGEEIAEGDLAIGDGALSSAGAAIGQSAGYELPYDMGGNRDLASETPAESDVLAALITDGESQDNSTATMRTVEPRGVGRATKPTQYTAEDKAADHILSKLRSGGWAELTDISRGYRGHFKDLEGAAGALLKKGKIQHDAKGGGDRYRLAEEAMLLDDYPADARIRMGEAYDRLTGGATNLSKEEKVDAEKYKALVTKHASRATGTSNEPAKPSKGEVPESVDLDGILPEVREALGDGGAALTPAERYRAGEKLDSILDELRAERRKLMAKQDAIVGEARTKFDQIEKNLAFIRRALTPRHEADDAFEDALVLEGQLGEDKGHHHFDGKSYYADTAFMNAMRDIMPGQELKHLGFGEFSWVGSEGEVEFDRMRGKDFPGQSGRSHKLYDNQSGKLIKKLIAAMEKKGKSELVKESLDEGYVKSYRVAVRGSKPKIAKLMSDAKIPFTPADAPIPSWKEAGVVVGNVPAEHMNKLRKLFADDPSLEGKFMRNSSSESIDEGLKSTKTARWVEAKLLGGWMSAWLVKLEGKHAWVQFADDAPNRRVSLSDVREIKETLDEATGKPLKGKKLDMEFQRLFKLHGDRVRFNIMDLGKLKRAVTDAAAAGEDMEAAMVAAVKKYRVNESYQSGDRGALKCDMEKGCDSPVTHIDNKGYVYCAKHGERRKSGGTPCRKMRPAEIKKLEGGGTIGYRAEGLDEASTSRVGQFFVIVNKKSGQATSPIYQGSARADAELRKRGGESKAGEQVMDAMWHNPSREKLRRSGTIGEGLADALLAAVS